MLNLLFENKDIEIEEKNPDCFPLNKELNFTQLYTTILISTIAEMHIQRKRGVNLLFWHSGFVKTDKQSLTF